MTVRVRQLVRVAGGQIRPPQPPPVPPTMFFVQQPTDTPVGELFNPPVTVQVSDHRPGDVLILSMSSGACAIGTISAITDANGIATFNGLRAGFTPSEGCSVEVRNDSRPDIATIVSEPFNVTSIVVSGWELVSRGSVGAFLATALRTESLTLDSTGTTDAFAVTSTINFSTYYISDSRGNIWTLLSWIGFTPGGLLGLWRATSNPDNPPSFEPILGTSGSLIFYSQYPAMAVYNFRRQTAGAGVIIGSPYQNTVFSNTVGPQQPMTIPFTNSLVMTGYADNDWYTPWITEPAGYTGREYVGIAGFGNGNLLGAYKILDQASVENPTWLTSGVANIAMIMGAFEA